VHSGERFKPTAVDSDATVKPERLKCIDLCGYIVRWNSICNERGRVRRWRARSTDVAKTLYTFTYVYQAADRLGGCDPRPGNPGPIAKSLVGTIVGFRPESVQIEIRSDNGEIVIGDIREGTIAHRAKRPLFDSPAFSDGRSKKFRTQLRAIAGIMRSGLQ